MTTNCSTSFRNRSVAGSGLSALFLIGLLIWALLGGESGLAGSGSGLGDGNGGVGDGSGLGMGDGSGTRVSGSGPGAGESGDGPGADPDGDTDVLRGTPNGDGPQVLAAQQQMSGSEVPPAPVPEFGFDVDETVPPPPPQAPPNVVADKSPFGQDPNAKTRSGREGIAGGAEFMGVKAKGKSFVYIVDYSGSMGTDNRIVHAKLELQKSIDRLEPGSKFFIIAFESVAHPMPAEGLVTANSANKGKYIDWAKSLPPMGGTEPQDALVQALALKPDAIFLMTDGEFGSPMEVDAAIMTGNAWVQAQIHTIAFHSRLGETHLQDIARQTGGQYRFVPPP